MEKINELIITEKSSQAKAIAKTLGYTKKENGYWTHPQTGNVIVNCIGHLVNLAFPKDIDPRYKRWDLEILPFKPKEWKLVPTVNKEKQLKLVSSLIKKASSIVIAADKEREGELLVVELLNLYNFKGERKRALYTEITPRAIKEAFVPENIVPASQTYPLYLEALARQRADYLIGLNTTMGMNAKNRGLIEGNISYGRVVTAVNFIVQERERAIRNHISKNYYSIDALIGKEKMASKWTIPDSLKRCLDPESEDYSEDKAKEEVLNVINSIKGKNAIINKKEVTLKKTKQPQGFDLAELQSEASKKYKFGVTKTLKTAQSLYESGYLTYPRTDSAHFDEKEFSNAKNVLESIKKAFNNEKYSNLVDNADCKIKTQIWNTSKVTDHSAIAPTSVPPNISSLSDEEQKIYKIVSERFLAQFYPEYVYENTKYTMSIGGEEFTASGNVPKELGWKVIYSEDKDAEEQLPDFKEKSEQPVEELKIKESATKPPARFTEASLVAEMKVAHKYVKDKKLKAVLKDVGGIGRPSTASSHVDKIINVGYAENKKSKLHGTELGLIADEIAPEILRDPATTSYWEQLLSDIGRGEGDFDEFIAKQEKVLDKIMDYIKNNDKAKLKKAFTSFVCPVCDSPAMGRKGPHGKYFKCTNTEKCGVNLPNVGGRPGKPVKKKELATDKCPECNNKIIRREGGGNFYWQCEKFYDKENPCKTRCRDNDGKLGEKIVPKPKPTSEFTCPKCKKGKLVKRAQKKDPNKFFWGCNAFPKCKNIVNDKDGKPEGF